MDVIRSDEELTLETSILLSSYGDNLTLSSPFDIVSLPQRGGSIVSLETEPFYGSLS